MTVGILAPREERGLLMIFKAYHNLVSTLPQVSYCVHTEADEKIGYIAINGIRPEIPDSISACLIPGKEVVHAGFSMIASKLVQPVFESLQNEVDRFVISGHSLGAAVAVSFVLSNFFKDLPEETRSKCNIFVYSLPPFISGMNSHSNIDTQFEGLGVSLISRRLAEDIVNSAAPLSKVLGAPMVFPDFITKNEDVYNFEADHTSSVLDWTKMEQGVTLQHRLPVVYSSLIIRRDGSLDESMTSQPFEKYLESKFTELFSKSSNECIQFVNKSETDKHIVELRDDIRSSDPIEINPQLLGMLMFVGVPPTINDLIKDSVQKGDYTELIALVTRLSAILPMLLASAQ